MFKKSVFLVVVLCLCTVCFTHSERQKNVKTMGKESSIAIGTTNLDYATNENNRMVVKSAGNADGPAAVQYLVGGLLFKIGVADFFNSDSNWVTRRTDGNAEVEAGYKFGYVPNDTVLAITKGRDIEFLIPLSFAIRGDTVYIPNGPAQKISKYSMRGKKLGELKVRRPDCANVSCIYCMDGCIPDYISVLENGNILINSWNGDMVEVNQQNGAVVGEKRHAADSKNWVYRNNYLFYKEAGILADAQNKFHSIPKRYDRSDADKADYYMQGSSVAELYLSDDKNLIYRTIENGKASAGKKLNVPPELLRDAEAIGAIHFVYASSNELAFVAQGGDFNTDRVIKYNLKNNSFVDRKLRIEYTGELFIGENANLWPSCTVYSYGTPDAIYALFTDKDFVHFYKFDVSSL
jgi:hypothetical protein